MNTVSYSNIVLVLCSPGAVIPVDEETNVQMTVFSYKGLVIAVYTGLTY